MKMKGTLGSEIPTYRCVPGISTIQGGYKILRELQFHSCVLDHSIWKTKEDKIDTG